MDAAGISELHARVCKALADPTRLLILNELRDGPRPVGDLAEALGISQPNASRHLAMLRDRGFVTAERVGSRVHYTLASPKILRAMDLLREFMTEEMGARPATRLAVAEPARPGTLAVARVDAEEIYELHARVCKAIADGKRLLIINELRDAPRTAGELSSALAVAQANASQHLAILRDRGIVTARRSGSNMYYSLSSEKIIQAVDLLYEFMAEQAESLRSLAG